MKPPYLWTPATPQQYHADPCERPSLTASIATTLLQRSPCHAWEEHPRLGGRAKTVTRAMDVGSAVHAWLLGAGAEVIMVDAGDYRTKAAQEARDAIREDGGIPLLRHEFATAEEMVAAVREQLFVFGIALDGQSEAAVVWEEESRHGPVLCRGMLDHLALGRATIYDLKTTANAHPDACARRMVDGGYDIQWAAYTSALRALRPDIAGREEMVFLFAETEHPYLLTPARPDGSMRCHGEARWRRAVETWGRCLAEDRWPGYVDPLGEGGGIIEVAAPTWAVLREEEAAA